MTLKESIENFKEEAFPQMAPNALATLNKGIEDLVAEGIESQALKEGDTIPGFHLPGAGGEPVSAKEQLEKGPLVISFYRGGWCPYCNLELRALQMKLPEIEALGGTLIAISPELPDNSLSTAEKNELKFPVLSDLDNKVAREFGLVFELAEEVADLSRNHFGVDLTEINGTEKFELPMPGTYVVGRDGVVEYAFVSADYSERAEPAEIVAALKRLAS